MTSDVGRVVVHIDASFDSWRSAARQLLSAGVAPARVEWVVGEGEGIEGLPAADPSIRLALSRRFIELAERVASSGAAPSTCALLYRVAYRLVNENRDLLSLGDDADVAAIHALDREQVVAEAGTQQAVPETELPVSELGRPATPAPVAAALRPGLDEVFAALPGALRRMSDVQRTARSAAAWIPGEWTPDSVASAIRACEGCDLADHSRAVASSPTPQVVRVMVVGEQPVDANAGRHEFSGPAGGVFDRALVAAGLERSELYLTSAVKHPARDMESGRPRAPLPAEIVACRPWLDAEIRRYRPEIIVCLGAIAARALAGASFRLLDERGEFVQTKDGFTMIATVHPASVLRASEEPALPYEEWLVADLRRVRERLDGATP